MEATNNRKLIRPNLVSMKDQPPPAARQGGGLQKKTAPPEQTHAENFYYIKQMQSKTHMVVVLKDGEELQGVIEWYDRTCLKFNREGAPNLLLYKSCIKYMYKA